MIRPRKLKRFCAHCGKHQEHEVERVKKRRASELKWGQRRFREVTSGYRGFPRPKPEGREKSTRRVNLLYRCTVCNRRWNAPAKRSKKFELKEQ